MPKCRRVPSRLISMRSEVQLLSGPYLQVGAPLRDTLVAARCISCLRRLRRWPRQGGVIVYDRAYEEPLGTRAVQLADVQLPLAMAGLGVACWPLQPAPAIVAETVPLMDAELIVPEVDAVIVHPLQDNGGKVMA